MPIDKPSELESICCPLLPTVFPFILCVLSLPLIITGANNVLPVCFDDVDGIIDEACLSEPTLDLSLSAPTAFSPVTFWVYLNVINKLPLESLLTTFIKLYSLKSPLLYRNKTPIRVPITLSYSIVSELRQCTILFTLNKMNHLKSLSSISRFAASRRSITISETSNRLNIKKSSLFDIVIS